MTNEHAHAQFEADRELSKTSDLDIVLTNEEGEDVCKDCRYIISQCICLLTAIEDMELSWKFLKEAIDTKVELLQENVNKVQKQLKDLV